MSKEIVYEGSPDANATKEKAFVGLWNPREPRDLNQSAAGFIGSAPHDVFGALRGVPAEVGRGKTPTLRLARGEKAFSPDLVQVSRQPSILSVALPPEFLL